MCTIKIVDYLLLCSFAIVHLDTFWLRTRAPLVICETAPGDLTSTAYTKKHGTSCVETLFVISLLQLITSIFKFIYMFLFWMYVAPERKKIKPED